jgi:hypothetical protein
LAGRQSRSMVRQPCQPGCLAGPCPHERARPSWLSRPWLGRCPAPGDARRQGHLAARLAKTAEAQAAVEEAQERRQRLEQERLAALASRQQRKLAAQVRRGRCWCHAPSLACRPTPQPAPCPWVPPRPLPRLPPRAPAARAARLQAKVEDERRAAAAAREAAKGLQRALSEQLQAARLQEVQQLHSRIASRLRCGPAPPPPARPLPAAPHTQGLAGGMLCAEGPLEPAGRRLLAPALLARAGARTRGRRGSRAEPRCAQGGGREAAAAARADPGARGPGQGPRPEHGAAAALASQHAAQVRALAGARAPGRAPPSWRRLPRRLAAAGAGRRWPRDARRAQVPPAPRLCAGHPAAWRCWCRARPAAAGCSSRRAAAAGGWGPQAAMARAARASAARPPPATWSSAASGPGWSASRWTGALAGGRGWLASRRNERGPTCWAAPLAACRAGCPAPPWGPSTRRGVRCAA